MITCLSELRLGNKATITNIEAGSAACRQKMFACGLIPGAEILVERIAPLGDPLQIRLNGTITLSIRKNEGRYVNVQLL